MEFSDGALKIGFQCPRRWSLILFSLGSRFESPGRSSCPTGYDVSYIHAPRRVISTLRILQLHNQYRFGGGEDTVVETEAVLLRQSGHQVTQYIVQNPSNPVMSAKSLALAPWNPFARSGIKRVVAAAEFDVAHVHNTWYALTPSIFSQLKQNGLRVVFTAHNYRLACINAQLIREGRKCEACVGRSPLPGIRFSCYRDSIVGSVAAATTIGLNRAAQTWNRFVDTFLAPTPYVARILERSGIEGKRIFVKPHMTLDPGERETSPSKSGVLLFVGRLSSEKGIEMLLSAWEGIRRSDLKLDIIGDGPLQESLLARRPPGVRLLGRLGRSEALDRMRQSRALLFPSLTAETFGLVVAEAMSCGLPVLTNEDLPLLELFDEQSGAIRLRPDEGSWANALDSLVDDERVDELGTLSRQTYLQKFSPVNGIPALEGYLSRSAPPLSS